MTTNKPKMFTDQMAKNIFVFDKVLPSSSRGKVYKLPKYSIKKQIKRNSLGML